MFGNEPFYTAASQQPAPGDELGGGCKLGEQERG